MPRVNLGSNMGRRGDGIDMDKKYGGALSGTRKHVKFSAAKTMALSEYIFTKIHLKSENPSGNVSKSARKYQVGGMLVCGTGDITYNM